jgi:uncharacterized protein (TIGR02118 family)
LIRLTILYPNKEGGRFDLDYYLNTHMPMSIEKQGPLLKGVTVEHGISGVQPGSKPEDVVICQFTYETVEAFFEAFMPHADLLQGDIPNYTDIEPVMQFSEIKISQ